MNERKTEDMVDRLLRQKGYFRQGSGIVIEKQQSDNPRIRKLLESASKRGKGAGKPEFLIRSSAHVDFIIVIECKADTRKHISDTLDKYADYAVDGVLLYASYLSRDFDVLAVAVSGEEPSSKRVSHYLHLRGADKAVEHLGAKSIVSFEEYYESFLHSDIKQRQDYQALSDYSRKLNRELQDKKVTEAERGFLISGILVALQNAAFKSSFALQTTSKRLAESLVATIRDEFRNAGLPEDRREDLAQAFSFISHSPALSDLEYFVQLIRDIDENINSFMRTHQYFDTIGQFYVEFLKYANNDKGLGIVLTPSHIAELFAELAEVKKDSVVYDNCCGTGGLLIAAMKAMIRDAGADEKIKTRIKNKQIYGMEYQTKIYALAVSNMILHGDGKTNIFKGDCFEDASGAIPLRGITVGLLNPPYKRKDAKEDPEEFDFVLNNMERLEPGGRCIAILPITCATAPDGVIAERKRAILEKHTLEAAMSMPIALFHNSDTTVVTSIMVFTAHRPHPKGKKSWFGYWRDDGYVKTKHRGRIDSLGRWTGIRTEWINAFRSREAIEGLSLLREVGPSDEWCAEAYLETDYDRIDSNALAAAVKRFVLRDVMILHESRSEISDAEQ
jgi:type I restriction enzyme M protein